MPRLNPIAVHEAGHAVVTILERTTFSHVTIETRGNSLGAVHMTRVRIGNDEDVRIKLAGAMAERLNCRTWHWRLACGAEEDLESVGKFFRDNERLRVLIKYNVEATEAQLIEHWTEVDLVARALMRWKTLEYDEVRGLCDAASELPRKMPPGRLDDEMWLPLWRRLEWHIENPSGIEGFLERAIRS
jgi:hypothetical protein